MTLREYIAEAEALISKKNYNKYSSERLDGNKKPNKKDTGSEFLGKPRKATYRSDENEVSKGSIRSDAEGTKHWTSLKNSNAYSPEDEESRSERRIRDETPAFYTKGNHNKYDSNRLGGDGNPNRKDTGNSFLGKARSATYRSDEHEASSGSPSKELRGKDISAFTKTSK